MKALFETICCPLIAGPLAKLLHEDNNSQLLLEVKAKSAPLPSLLSMIGVIGTVTWSKQYPLNELIEFLNVQMAIT